ncbi:hypothetical protein [Flavivirga jejuensis]|uniref:YD repeat-containing protein n=1 Tax=Flavivirga jejuensis TaxID=870487 RepID=A0ABT8WQ45_9FLAO|nr:hypothetical protein [Flavivirga jejuensis]MDO5975292.1 hypothetical protein [Flavivirga jejuensis]
MNTRLFLLLGFILTFKIAIAQDLPEIVYPSPTAAALGEYGNTPISLSTGTPNINIPLWEIKGRKLSVPISLSYRASGIKVEEHGSKVGLGWTLNAGGVISRVVKDEEDNSNQGMSNSPAIGDLLSRFSDTYYAIHDGLRWIRDYYDKEPDLYYYNFLGYSGKFVFDDAENPIVSPDINFKIALNNNPLDPMQIIDANGTIYTFGYLEHETGTGHVTAYYITRIESYDLTEWIDFEYIQEKYKTLTNDREETYISHSQTINALTYQYAKSPTSYGQRLSKITTSFGETVTFNGGEVREDLRDSNLIEEAKRPKTIGGIEISYSGNCIKKIDFDYEFIESETPGRVNGSTTSYNWANKRLYLKSLTETTCNGDDIKTHAFKYYGRTADNKDMLPNKLSFAQDHWGYFNGAITNTSYRPAFSGDVPKINYSHTPEYVNRQVPGADREPSYPHMEYGTLKSITYPTGGETEFVFEQHTNILSDYTFNNFNSNAGGLRVAEIKNKIDGSVVKHRTFTYSGGQYADYPNYGNSKTVFRTVIDNHDISHYHIHPAYRWDYYMDGVPFGSSDINDNPNENYFYKIGSGNPIALGTTNGYHLSYERVTEKEIGNGRIVHNFTVPIFLGLLNSTVYWFRRYAGSIVQAYNLGSFDAESYEWPYNNKRIDWSWRRGLPTSKFYYSETNELIKSIGYQYDYVQLKGTKRKIQYNYLTGDYQLYLDYDVPMTGLTFKYTELYHADGIKPEETYYLADYELGLGVALINKETITENGVTTIKNHTYNNQNQLTSTSFSNSKSETIVSESKYPQDFAAPNNVYQKMVDANIINPVIEQKTKNGAVTLSTLKNNYEDWGNAIYAPDIIKSSKGSDALEDRVEFIGYYNNGNVQEVKKSDGTHIVYIWGYNEKFPIAKIENATYSEVSSQITNLHTKSNDDDDRTVDVIDSSGVVTSYVGNEGQLRAALNTLRNLSDALVTTYTFDPLIGVTSITNPKGYTMYYEYDDFNRLEQVKDANGKILSQNEYHYKGQQ